MDEMNGAFEEKKRRKGGKRLMQPEKAAKAAKEPRAEKPPRVPRETSGKTGKVVGIVAGVLVVAYLGLGAWASASHKIYPNVMMGDTNYGGMTEQQVAEQLKASVAQAKGAGVDFVLPDGTEVAHVSLDAMPEYVDFDGLAKHIYNVYGCNDSFLTAGAKYLRALFKPQDAAQVVDAAYSPDLMENLVDTVCDSINCDPVEFAINVTEDGKVSVTKPQDGRATTDTAKDQIGVYLNGAYLSGGDPSEIVLEPASEGGVYELPRAKIDGCPLDMSFSGLKTAVVNLAHNAEQTGKQLDRAALARDFTQAVVDELVPRAMLAMQQSGRKVLVAAGGVAANSFIRAELEKECRKHGYRLYMPPLKLCGDNGAMIGAQAYYEYLAGNIADQTLNAYATRSMEGEAL